MKLEAVIFDMDGTLLDTQIEAFKAWDYAGQLQGFENVGQDGTSVCGMNEEGWSGYLAEKYKGLDIERFKKDTWEYLETKAELRPKAGMFELLNFIKTTGLKIGIASGTDPRIIEKNMRKLNALDYFDAFAGGHDVQNGKPDPDIYLLVAERLGVNPENCIIFEDSSNGILSGYRAGMKCIGVPDVAELNCQARECCFKIIKKLDDAIEIIEKLI